METDGLIGILNRYPEGLCEYLSKPGEMKGWDVYEGISANPGFIFDFIEFYTELKMYWNWDILAMRKDLTLKIVKRYEKYWDLKILVTNPDLPLEVIEEYMPRWMRPSSQGFSYWQHISSNRHLTEAFIDDHQEDLDWLILAKNPALTANIILKYAYRWDYVGAWDNISSNHSINILIIERYPEKINGKLLSANPAITVQMVIIMEGSIDWVTLSSNPALTIEMIDLHPELMNWIQVTKNPALTVEIIRAYPNHIDWLEVSASPLMTPELTDEFLYKWTQEGHLHADINFTNDMIERYRQRADEPRVRKFFSSSSGITLTIIDNNLELLDWDVLSANLYISNHDIVDYRYVKIYESDRLPGDILVNLASVQAAGESITDLTPKIERFIDEASSASDVESVLSRSSGISGSESEGGISEPEVLKSEISEGDDLSFGSDDLELFETNRQVQTQLEQEDEDLLRPYQLGQSSIYNEIITIVVMRVYPWNYDILSATRQFDRAGTLLRAHLDQWNWTLLSGNLSLHINLILTNSTLPWNITVLSKRDFSDVRGRIAEEREEVKIYGFPSPHSVSLLSYGDSQEEREFLQQDIPINEQPSHWEFLIEKIRENQLRQWEILAEDIGTLEEDETKDLRRYERINNPHRAIEERYRLQLTQEQLLMRESQLKLTRNEYTKIINDPDSQIPPGLNYGQYNTPEDIQRKRILNLHPRSSQVHPREQTIMTPYRLWDIQYNQYPSGLNYRGYKLGSEYDLRLELYYSYAQDPEGIEDLIRLMYRTIYITIKADYYPNRPYSITNQEQEYQRYRRLDTTLDVIIKKIRRAKRKLHNPYLQGIYREINTYINNLDVTPQIIDVISTSPESEVRIRSPRNPGYHYVDIQYSDEVNDILAAYLWAINLHQDDPEAIQIITDRIEDLLNEAWGEMTTRRVEYNTGSRPRHHWYPSTLDHPITLNDLPQ